MFPSRNQQSVRSCNGAGHLAQPAKAPYTNEILPLVRSGKKNKVNILFHASVKNIEFV